MSALSRFVFTPLLLGLAALAGAQSADSSREELQLAAMEALMTAPPERALPLARKVVEGNYSAEMKERALFVLSQIDAPEARELIAGVATSGTGDTRYEAVRMIGIGGDRASLELLGRMYEPGNDRLNEAILEAFLIADDTDAVYAIAGKSLEAGDSEGFSTAVEMLGAMGAREHLGRLRAASTAGGSDATAALINAYAISGDLDSLRAMATDGSDPDRQLRAIEALGVVGGDTVDQLLLEIYRGATGEPVREAALEGMMISGYDDGVLELYRASDDPAEKKALLEYLVMMDSDEVWAIIDSALDGGR
jgi:HEAT repeat protein